MNDTSEFRSPTGSEHSHSHRNWGLFSSLFLNLKPGNATNDSRHASSHESMAIRGIHNHLRIDIKETALLHSDR
jgi:hypothetical protein